MPHPPPLGHLVRWKRKALGFTLRELAARAGLGSPSFVLYIENETRVPSRAVARRLAVALNEDPGLFEAWAQLLGRSGTQSTLEAARRILSTEDLPIEMVHRGSAPGAAVLRVPVIPAGADPGVSLRPECPVIETLRVPLSTLPPPERVTLPYACALEGDLVRRLPELRGRGHALFVRDELPPEPHGITAVRTPDGVRLARVLWNGRTLLLLPAPGASDFDVLPADGPSSLASLVAGRLIRILVRP